MAASWVFPWVDTRVYQWVEKKANQWVATRAALWENPRVGLTADRWAVRWAGSRAFLSAASMGRRRAELKGIPWVDSTELPRAERWVNWKVGC